MAIDTLVITNEASRSGVVATINSVTEEVSQPVGEYTVNFTASGLEEGEFYTLTLTADQELAFYGTVFCTSTPVGQLLKLVPDTDVEGESDQEYTIYGG